MPKEEELKGKKKRRTRTAKQEIGLTPSGFRILKNSPSR
jgi:hypothetical protein